MDFHAEKAPKAYSPLTAERSNLRAIRKAQIPAVKEPLGLTREDGKRPDGTTLIPLAQSKPLAWNVTVPDTYAPSHLPNTSITAGAAADIAAVNKPAKYDKLRGTHLFFSMQSRREDHGTHKRRNLYKKSEED